MEIRKALAGVAAAGLLIGSSAAAAAPAEAPRTASSVSDKEELAGMGTIGLLIGAAVIAAVVLMVSSDDDEPVSP